MLGPSRPLPRVGSPARVTYFGGSSERGVVVGVHDEGRRLEVRSESGEIMQFVLSPSTAKFMVPGSAGTERLELL